MEEENRKPSAKMMSPIEVEQNEKAYSDALSKVADTLDLSYYYLGDRYIFSANNKEI